MKYIPTSTEDLEKAARMAEALYELNQRTGIISVSGIGEPSVLLRPETWKEAFGERPEAIIEEKDGNRFYSYFDGNMKWETNEPIEEEKHEDA